MKGSIISIIEVMLTGIILVVAFYHFFPQYVIRSKWNRILLSIKVRDILNTIDGLGKTYEFATSTIEFKNFMGNITDPSIHGAMIWWKEIEDLSGYTEDTDIPYFTEAHKETMVDVELMSDEYDGSEGGTIGLWHFNEGSGCTVFDATTNNNGDLMPNCPVDNPRWVFGKLNTALDFDGFNDFVNVSDRDSLDSDHITIEAWVKLRSYPGDDTRLIEKYAQYAVKIMNSGRVRVYLSAGGWERKADSDESIPLNTWTHVAVTYNGTDVQIYFNGALDKTVNLYGSDTPIAYSDEDLLFGGTDVFLDGKMDEVRISSFARTDFDIRYDVYSFALGLGYPY